MEASNHTYDPQNPALYWKEVYSNPEKLVGFRFANRTATTRFVWIEPAAYSLELEPDTEYKLFTHEKQFTIEYDSDHQFTLWLDDSFGFILYKRVIKDESEDWVLDIDLSDNQFPPGPQT
ncbi:hypothetical protein SAMN04488128_1025 [Chitinophaga eiseniae]|uniref:Uncharacterized protein n=1 Tax=Chitinophaga eiseniae TaxID=634771 RepID=A0A1T4PU15_9BACT|nr:hypothetical protein [Chitinophaga eiseniae]SJZ95054.1 hypothetical protein SAMN04488128_1025 [Chitinophaga eiseniae]